MISLLLDLLGGLLWLAYLIVGAVIVIIVLLVVAVIFAICEIFKTFGDDKHA